MQLTKSRPIQVLEGDCGNRSQETATGNKHPPKEPPLGSTPLWREVAGMAPRQRLVASANKPRRSHLGQPNRRGGFVPSASRSGRTDLRRLDGRIVAALGTQTLDRRSRKQLREPSHDSLEHPRRCLPKAFLIPSGSVHSRATFTRGSFDSEDGPCAAANRGGTPRAID